MVRLVVKTLVFYKEQDKLLLLKRASHAGWCPGMEDLPGGKVESGESMPDAAIRELKEETGLSVGEPHLITTYEYEAELGRRVKEFVFCGIAGTKEVTIDPNEHSAFRWIDFKAIEQSELHPRVKEIIRQEKARIEEIISK